MKEYTTKSKIVDILREELSSVYCYNCEKNMDEDLCGNCHRKYMNWSLSHKAAESIAEEILKAVEK